MSISTPTATAAGAPERDTGALPTPTAVRRAQGESRSTPVMIAGQSSGRAAEASGATPAANSPLAPTADRDGTRRTMVASASTSAFRSASRSGSSATLVPQRGERESTMDELNNAHNEATNGAPTARVLSAPEESGSTATTTATCTPTKQFALAEQSVGANAGASAAANPMSLSANFIANHNGSEHSPAAAAFTFSAEQEQLQSEQDTEPPIPLCYTYFFSCTECVSQRIAQASQSAAT